MFLKVDFLKILEILRKTRGAELHFGQLMKSQVCNLTLKVNSPMGIFLGIVRNVRNNYFQENLSVIASANITYTFTVVYSQ